MRSMKVLLVCGALFLLALASCGSMPHVLYGKRIAGQVVDADAGQPIPGCARCLSSGSQPSSREDSPDTTRKRSATTRRRP